MFRTFALLVCLIPITVSAEEYVCSMYWDEPSFAPYVLSVKRSGEQFVLNSNNMLGGNGTFSAEKIQEDAEQIAITQLYAGGVIEVFLINKESLKIEHNQVSTEGNIFWINRRGTCMVGE